MEDKGILMKATKNTVLLVLIFICWIVVGTWNHSWAKDFGPFQGKILDADTQEPVEGVVLLILWRETHFFAGSTFYDAQETLTDKNGEFHLPGIWVLNPWTRLGLESYLTIYKSGYQPISSGAWRDWKGFTPKLEYVLRVEDGKPLILLRQLTVEERKKHVRPYWGDIPHEKAKLLIQEINKERKFLGLGEVGPVRR